MDLLSLLELLFPEVSYREFYREIFPLGTLQQKGDFTPGVYNGIAVSVGKGSQRTKRFTITDDLDVIDDLALTDDFCLMSPISYAGKHRTSGNARFLHALTIDLDGIDTINHWDFFLYQLENGLEMRKVVWGLPKPTYLVSSGTGIHLYYVFEKPIPLFPNIVKELEKLKKRLTWQAWTQGASSLVDNVQYESLFQGFRMVGTATKVKTRCRAFRYGEKVTVEYLNQFVPPDDQAKEFVYKSDLTLKEAKKLYPEWYEKRIIEGQPRGTWVCKKDLYDWWIRKIYEKAEQGHRYWCIMTLATYAKKCGVPRNTLEKDAYSLVPFLNSIGDEFTEDDVLHALEAFSDSYITYPIDTIVNRTAIPIVKNKRNHRKQSLHLRLARAQRDILCEVRGKSDWREGNGRKPKRYLIRDYAYKNPEANHSQIAQALGVSRSTVIKWLKGKWEPEYHVERLYLDGFRMIPPGE